MAGRFVPPEINLGARLLVIAEAPGRTEVTLGRPLVGPSGNELVRAFVAAGHGRSTASLTNALLCRPPGAGNLFDYLAGLAARNRKRKAQGRDLIFSPLACCRPRLMAEVANAQAVLLLGAASRMTIYGQDWRSSEKGYLKHRGFPAWVDLLGANRRVQVLATVHPAFVLRARRWTEIFRSDVAKAIRMAHGHLTWTPPEKVFFPRPDQLLNVLQSFEHTPALDVESTLAKSPLDVKLHCIGIGDYTRATCVPIASVHGQRFDEGMLHWYSPWERERVIEILLGWLADPAGIMAIHNSVFDLTVLERAGAYDGQLPGLVVRRRVFDTILAHHVVWSEFRHDLGFCSSQYTDAEEHKDVDHTAWASDREQQSYCMDDCAVTSFIAAKLASDQRLVEQKKAYTTDMRLSRFCRELHKIGFGFDVATRDRLYVLYSGKMRQAEQATRAAASIGLPSGASAGQRKLAEALNPGSRDQVAAYLFDACGITPVPESAGGLTPKGDPSVSRDNLFYLIDRGLPASLEEFIQCVIDYREADKARGTYCTIEPSPDGRVRASWHPHVVVSGRLSTSEPNLLNIKGPLREMFVAGPNHTLVFLDKAQLELRIVAWEAQDHELIAAFAAGLDVHRVNTAAILGLPGPDAVDDKQRKFGKTFTYAVQYGAGVRKAWQMVRNFRDKDGSRPYKDLPYRAAETAYKRWWEVRAPIKRYFEAGVVSWRENGYLAESIHGRRRYFLDGEEEEKEAMSNFRIQSGAAADVNDAQERVAAEFPWGFAGSYTGIVHQNYDSIGIEVPSGMEIDVGRRAAQLMDSTLGDMELPVDIQVGQNWFNLTEIPRNG